jgi:hypothetical protein
MVQWGVIVNGMSAVPWLQIKWAKIEWLAGAIQLRPWYWYL